MCMPHTITVYIHCDIKLNIYICILLKRTILDATTC